MTFDDHNQDDQDDSTGCDCGIHPMPLCQTLQFWMIEVTTKMGMGQNHVALVNIKIGGKWMFIP